MLWVDAAKIGLPAFPLHADKTPACAHGFKDAVRGDDLRRLFDASPDAELIGVPTGEISGIDALDIDSSRHSEAQQWLRTAGLPATRIHQTKSGGWHYIFRHSKGLRNWTSRPVPGIDGRGDGGYIVWWPAAGYAVNSVPLVDWPPRLLKLFKAPKSQAKPIALPPINEPRLSSVIRAAGSAVNGSRNDLLFWAACRCSEWISAGELTARVAEQLLMGAGQRSGLDEIEIRRTIASGLVRAGGSHGNSS